MAVYDVCALQFTLYCFSLCLQQCFTLKQLVSFDTSFLIQIVFCHIFVFILGNEKTFSFFSILDTKVIAELHAFVLEFSNLSRTLLYLFLIYRFSLAAQSSSLIVLFWCISASKSLWSSQVINHYIQCDVSIRTGQGCPGLSSMDTMIQQRHMKKHSFLRG